MAYKRDGDTVTLTMTESQYESLLIALAGFAIELDDDRYAHFLQLANSLNEGNPDWVPFDASEGVTE